MYPEKTTDLSEVTDKLYTLLPCYLVKIYYRLSLYDPSQVSFRLSQLPVHKSREQISTDSLQCLFSELLKLFTLLASTTLSGNEFQCMVHDSVKNLFPHLFYIVF